MHRKDVIVIYFVAFLDLFAISLIVPLLQKRARELGATPTITGLLGSVYGALQLFSSPTVGKWSDVSGCRYVLLWCLVLCAASYSLLIFATTFTVFVLSRICSGIFKHTQSLSKAYVAQTTTKADHTAVFGYLGSVSSIGFILGPIIGGHIAETDSGFEKVAAFTAVCFLVLYVTALVLLPSAAKVVSRSDSSQQVAENDEASLHLLKYIRAMNWPELWDILAVRLFMGIAVVMYRTNFPLILEYRYDAPSIANGYLLSFSAGVSTVASFFAGRVARFYGDDKRLLAHAQLLQFASLVALVLAPTLWYLPVCLATLSTSNALARIASMNVTLGAGKREDAGALVGLGASVLSLARMIAPMLGGIAQEVDENGPCIVASAFSLLALVTWQVGLTLQKPKCD